MASTEPREVPTGSCDCTPVSPGGRGGARAQLLDEFLVGTVQGLMLGLRMHGCHITVVLTSSSLLDAGCQLESS